MFKLSKKTKLEELAKSQGLSSTKQLADATNIPQGTLGRYNANLRKNGPKSIYQATIENIVKLAEFAHQTPGELLDWLLNVERDNDLVVDRENQTIQGVPIENHLVFEELLDALLANGNMGYIPTPEDINKILVEWSDIPKATLNKIRKNYIDSVKYELAKSQIKPDRK